LRGFGGDLAIQNVIMKKLCQGKFDQNDKISFMTGHRKYQTQKTPPKRGYVD
jgi:hypothetical protein